MNDEIINNPKAYLKGNGEGFVLEANFLPHPRKALHTEGIFLV